MESIFISLFPSDYWLLKESACPVLIQTERIVSWLFSKPGDSKHDCRMWVHLETAQTCSRRRCKEHHRNHFNICPNKGKPSHHRSWKELSQNLKNQNWFHPSSSPGLSNSRDVGGVQVCNQSVCRRHQTKSCNHCRAERSQQGKLENDVQGTFLCPFLPSCGEPSFVKPFNCT